MAEYNTGNVHQKQFSHLLLKREHLCLLLYGKGSGPIFSDVAYSGHGSLHFDVANTIFMAL